MMILATNPQTILTNMVWGARGPKTLGIYESLCNLYDKQSNPILPNDNPNHQIQNYEN